MLILLALSAAAFYAAAGVAIRMDLDGRAEQALAALCIFFALILTPIYALGLLGVLTRGALAGASLALFGGVFAASCRGVRPKEHAARVASAIRSMALLPVDALRMTARAGSLAFFATAIALLVLLWSVAATYLAASDAWDGIGYHEAIIGYAIQNHGFARVKVPNNFFFEAINGNPRHSEMISVWLVIFWDRRLIELPNTLGAPVYLLAVYLLCRRYREDPSTSIGWACGALLMPGAVLLLRSTYIDLLVAGFVMAALHFTTRPGLRVKDSWITAVALALMIGSKQMGASWGALLALIACARLLSISRGRGREVALTIAGAAVILIGLGAPIYLRNWVIFKNPLWAAAFRVPILGISFPGNTPLSAVSDMNQPIAAVWRAMIDPFKPGLDFADTRVFGYGIAIPLLLLPLSIAAAARAFWEFGVDIVRRARRQEAGGEDAALAWNFLVVAAFGVLTAALSPALWQARYNLHVAAVITVACAYLSGRSGYLRAGEGAMAATLFVNALYLFWANPGLIPGPREMAKLASLPAEERAARRQNPWTLDDATARRRDAELRGALAVFTDGTRFIGPVFNEDYSNRVEYVHGRTDAETLAEIDRLNPKWVVTGAGTGLARLLNGAPERWRIVGAMSAASAAGSIAYERLDP